MRTYLVGLIFGVLLPLLAFSGFLVMHSAEREQDAIAAAARYRTHIAATVIEDEIGALRGHLFLLAGGMGAENSDLKEFYARAKAAFDGMTVTLSTPSGAEIINTSRPFGAELPSAPDPGAIRRVADQLQPEVADLPQDPITHRPIVTINVPVIQEGKPEYVLSLDITSTLPRILTELHIPDGWIAAIFDPQGYQIGRSVDPGPYLGQPARPEFREHIRTEEEGWVPGRSREGLPMFTSFVHTKLTGWVVVVAIPRETLLAPVRQTTRSLLLLGGAIVALAIVMAILIGGGIAAPVIGLVPIAEAVGRGESDRPTPDPAHRGKCGRPLAVRRR